MPSWRQLISIAIAALVLRFTVFAIACHRYQLTTPQFARLYDSNDYLITARAILGDRTQFDEYHGRVFPGFPALIAFCVKCGVPIHVAAIGINWLCGALAAVLAAIIFADLRVGWAVAILYLMNSSLALSEAPMLALSLVGLLAATRDSTVIGGVFFALAGFMRPMAVFAALAWVFAALMQGKLRSVVLFVTSGLIVFAAGIWTLHLWRGDAIANVRYYITSPNAYGGHLLAVPFRSLIFVPLESGVTLGRMLNVYTHAAVTLLACVFAIRAALISPDIRNRLAAIWLTLNTAFVVSLGSVWAFECFIRFTFPALPAEVWTLRAVLPRGKWAAVWIVIAALSVVAAIGSISPDAARIAKGP